MKRIGSSLASLSLLLSWPAPAAQQPCPPPAATALAAAHYERVERELARRDMSGLSPEQRAERQRLLGVLREYRERADFGRNTDYPGQRVPYFVDRGGRRCAVANLLDHSGLGALTERVAKDHNHAWVAELEHDPEFAAWLERSGVTLSEAARIQAPGYWSRASPPPPPPDPRLGANGVLLRLGDYAGPEDGVSAGPAAGSRSPRAPAARAAATARGQSAAAATTAGSTPRGVPVTDLGPPDWVRWWSCNRNTYLRPHRLSPGGPITGANGDDDDATLRRARAALSTLLLERCADADGDVRFQATVALGRVGGPEAVPCLLALLDDPNRSVRHGAILALGATGSPRAVHALLHIASSGRAPGKDRTVGAWARPLAFAALGLEARYGGRTPIAGTVAQLARAAEGSQRDLVRTAALVYHELSGAAGIPELAASVLGPHREGEGDPIETRCRATEALAAGRDKKSLVQLLELTSGAQIQERRSAAVALGKRSDALALQPLQTAFELESEPLARGFLLIAIGTQGGDAARDFLLEQLDAGRKALRPWSALALGVLARAKPDAEITAALRKAWSLEANHDNHGAYLIACGLARDAATFGLMARALDSAKSGDVRRAAAEGLTLLGGADARRVVREHLGAETCGFVRAALCEALGYFGHTDDVAPIARLLAEETDSERRASIAAALGVHGTWAAWRVLVDVAKDPGAPAAVRGSALASLGLMLADHPGYELASVGARSNFAAFPDWLQFALSTSL